MKNNGQINNSINARDQGIDARQSGARLNRRSLKRLLSLLLAIYMLLNSFAFATDDGEQFPAVTSSAESGNVDEAPDEMDMSLEGDWETGVEVDPNTYVYRLRDETELSLGELIKSLKMPFALADVEYVTVLGSEEDLVTEQSEPLTVVAVEQDYVIYIERAFAEAGLAIYTLDGEMYTLRLRSLLADENVDLPVNELGEVMLDEIFSELQAISNYSYSMEYAQGPVSLSEILRAVRLPLQVESVTSVGVVEKAEGEAQRLSVARANGDYVITALADFDELELAVCTADDIYTIALLNGRAGQPTEAPTEAPVEETEPEPTEAPTPEPTEAPVEEVEAELTAEPTEAPTPEPTEAPVEEVEAELTAEPTEEPTPEPTEAPVEEVEVELTAEPTEEPTEEPTPEPTEAPVEEVEAELTAEPTEEPTEEPTPEPTEAPVEEVEVELTAEPTAEPAEEPEEAPAEETETDLVDEPRFGSSAEELDELASLFVGLTLGDAEQTALTVTANDLTKVYGEADPTPTATAEDLPEGCSVVVDAWRRAEGEDVGSYAVTLESVQILDADGLDVTENYDITYVPAQLTITKAAATVTADGGTKVYGDADPELTATVTGLVGNDTNTYTLSRAEGEDVGGYAVTLESVQILDADGLDVTENYDITYVPAQLTITKAAATVTADGGTKVYGDADPELTATVTGLKNGDEEGVIAYTVSREAGENVGSYAVTATGDAEQGNYDVVFADPATFTVARRPVTVRVLGDQSTVVYDAEDHYTSGYTVTAYDGDDTVCPVPYTLDDVNYDAVSEPATVEIRDVGKVSMGLDVSLFSNENPNFDATFQVEDGYQEITPRPVVMRPKDVEKVYGEEDPTLEEEIVYDSDDPADADKEGLMASDELAVFSMSRQSGENVGEYAIEISVEGQSNGNYHVRYETGTLTIRPAPLTVTVQDAEKDYGEDDPDWEVDFNGLQFNDTENVIRYTITREAGEDAGEYAVTAAGDGDFETNEEGAELQGNYSVTYVPGTLTINRLPLTIVAADDGKLYGEDDPELEAEVIGLPEADGEGNLPYEIIREAGENAGEVAVTIRMNGDDRSKDIHYTIARDAGEDVGDYRITISAEAVQGNYEVTCENAVFAIEPLQVTITADSFTVAYGEPDPELTAQLTGLDAADDVRTETRAGTGADAGAWFVVTTIVHAGRTDKLSYSIRREPGTEVGEYGIEFEGESVQSNYEIEYVPGTLTINPRIVVQKTLLNEAVNQTRTFTFRATLSNGSDEPYNEAPFTDNVYEFTVDVSKARPTAETGFPVPTGASVTVEELENEYYTTLLTLDGAAVEGLSATVTDVSENSYTFAYENTRKSICRIVVDGEPVLFVTLQGAVEYAGKNLNKTATIEMLRDYTLQAEDIVNIPSGYDITLTSADGGAYTVSRSDATAGMRLLSNSGTLALENITLNGASVQSSMPLVLNGGTLTLGDGATLTGAKGASALNVTSGTVNVNSGSSVTGNQATSGGALYVTGGHVHVNAPIRNNQADNGGALFMTGGTVSVNEGGGLTGNQATSGGAAYIQGGTFEMNAGGSVSDNQATAGNGGAIYATGGTMNLSGGSVTGNTATAGNGGAIYALNAATSVSGCTLSDNRARSGGAIGIEGGTLTVEAGSVFSDNEATEDGGAINATSGTITVNDGTIERNTAANDGGAIHVGSGSVEIKAGAVRKNTATNGNGGAICADSGSVTLSGGAYTENTAANGNGGAVYDVSGTVNYTGGSMTGNGAKNGAAIFVGSGIANVSASITGNAPTEGGAIGVGSDGARLFFDTNAHVYDNLLDGGQRNVYLDQDSEQVINAKSLSSGKKIGVYVPGDVTDENSLVVKHGDVTGYFGAYTGTNNLANFKNDRFPNDGIEVKYENNRLYWAKKLTYDVYYLKDYSAQFPPTTNYTQPPVCSNKGYYPRALTSNIYDLVMAMKLYEVHNTDFTNKVGANYATTAVYAYTYSNKAMSGFGDYLQTVRWDGVARKWTYTKQDGTAAPDNTEKLVIFYSAPAYLTIVNNNDLGLTLDISDLTVLGKNAAGDGLYGFVTAKNGATTETLLPVTHEDLILAAGESRKLLFPGAQDQEFVLKGTFTGASASADTLLDFTFNGVDQTPTGTAVDFTDRHYQFYDNDTAAEIVFGKALPICKIGDEPFPTLKKAMEYAVAQKAATGNSTYKIEMLVDYLVPAGDVLEIPAGYDITFTTAEKGTGELFFKGSGDRAMLSRDAGNSGSSIVARNSTLIVDNLAFDGRSLTAGGAGGAISANGCASVTITNCDIKGYRADKGGAIYVDNQSAGSSLTVRGCHFENCQTNSTGDKTGGGAIWTTARTLTVDDCEFVDCACAKGAAQAGAVFHNIQKNWSADSRTIIKECTFENCFAFGGSGGTVETDALDITIMNCSFDGSYTNKKDGNGGAINVYAQNSDSTSTYCIMRVFGCTFNASSAKSGTAKGGAIRCTTHDLILYGCRFTGTQSVTGGAVVMTNPNAKKLEIYACDFSGCTATGNGGAVNAPVPTIKVGDAPGEDLVLPEFLDFTLADVDTHGIEHTTFTDCTANRGGGIDNDKDNSTVAMENVDFTRCVAKTSSGGALYTKAQTLSITGEGNAFTDCTGQNSGGAVFQSRNADKSSVTLENCAFTGCQSNGGSGNGGALYCSAKSLTISGEANRFENCTANSSGGGLYHDCGGGKVAIENCAFDGCTAKAGNGGGLYTSTTNLTVSGAGSDFTDCTAQAEGGGLYQKDANNSSFTFSDGTFHNCEAVGNDGGAIRTGAKTVTLADATIEDSRSKARGGGLWMNPTTASLTNCTITGDTVTNTNGTGGGVYVGGGTTTYYSGTISECLSNGNGGGWYQASGTLYVLGGVISGQATNGGGLYQVKDNVYHYGGLVAGTATANGGGVYKNGGTYQLRGGNRDSIDYAGGTVGGATFEDAAFTSSASNGGAFYQASGTLNIRDGGTIGGEAGSVTATNGAGLYLATADGNNANSTVNLHEGGVICGSAETTANGGGAYIAGGTLNVGAYTNETTYTTGGEIRDNKASNGAGLYAAGGIVNVRSGSISGNVAKANGGGLYVAGGEVKLLGVLVTDNEAAKGGGAFVADEQTLSMDGWINTDLNITGNRATAGGGIAVGGSKAVLNFKNKVLVQDNTMGEGTLCNVYLDVDSNAVIRTNGWFSDASRVGVYASDEQREAHGVEGTPFGTYGNTSNLHRFVNDRDSRLYGVMSSDTNDKKIYWSKNICKITDAAGNLLYRDAAHSRPAVFTMLYSGNDSLKGQCAFNALSGAFYDAEGNPATPAFVKMLVDSYSSPVADTVQVPAVDVTLTTASKDDAEYPGPYVEGNADTVCVLKRGSIVSSFFATQKAARSAGTTFALENITLDGGSLLGSQISDRGGLIFARGKVELKDGATLQNSKTTGNGGAVSVGAKDDSASADSLSVSEGAVIRNCQGNWGGAVYLQNGTVTLAGTIEDSVAVNNGGGVQVNAGTLNMNGGAITGCTANGSGGGVFVNNSATMNMSGGQIKGNTAVSVGGGVGVNGTASRLYFEGSAQVTGNKKGGADCDVELNNDSNQIINVTEAGLARNARIGVFVPDGATLYTKHGDVLKPFGQYANARYLENFFNNRNDYSGSVFPGAADEATTIYWMTVFSLEVVNEVVSERADDANIPFTFTVTLADAEGQPITGEHGLMTFDEAGSATFTLKKGESLMANTLPVGATYTVTMAADDRFETDPESLTATGTIGAEVNGKVTIRSKETFVNTRKRGSLTVSKAVVDPRTDADEAFAFTVTLGDRTISRTYPAYDQNGDALESVVFTRGVAALSLKAGESVTIDDLPLETAYTVVEDLTSEQKDYYTAYPSQKQTGETGVASLAAFTNKKTVYVCKITTPTGLMYYTEGGEHKSAVYGRLEDAFEAINGGKLRTTSGSTTSRYTIEMIVPEYVMEGTATLSVNRTVMLTTADKDATDGFAYPADAVSPARVVRGFDGDSMIRTTTGTLYLTDITLDGDKENHRSTTNGGIVSAGSTLYIQEGATLQNSRSTANGSAVFIANSKRLYMTGGSITGNEVADAEGGAIGVGGRSAKLYFSGNARVAGNAMSTGEIANVYLDQDSNLVINAQGLGADAEIGVYVSGAQSASPFTKRGGNLCDFGTYTSADGLYHFVNDRTGLTGMARTTDARIVWLQLVPLTVTKRLVDPYSDADGREFTLSATFSGGPKGYSYLWSDGVTSRTLTEGASGRQELVFQKASGATPEADGAYDLGSQTFYLPAEISATLTETAGTGRTVEYYLTRMVETGATDAIHFTAPMNGTGHSATFTLDGVEAVSATVTNARLVCKLTEPTGALLYEDAARTIPAAYSVLDAGVVEKMSGTLYRKNGSEFTGAALMCKMLVTEYELTQPLPMTDLARSVTLTTAGAYDADCPYGGTGTRATLARGFDSVGSMIVSDSTLTVANLALDGKNAYDPANESEYNEETGASESRQYGGIVNVQGGSLTLSADALLTRGSARAGGAIHVAGDAQVTLSTNSRIENSRATQGGGAVYLASGALSVSGGAIDGCSATGADSRGGAIYLTGGATASLSSGAISDNEAALGGGAVYADSGVLTVSGGTLSGNRATDGASYGGAIYLAGSAAATLSGGTVSGNTASVGGGAVYAGSASALTVRGSASITGNAAQGATTTYGGAIFATAQSSVTVSGGTISGGSAASANYGGAVYLESSAAFGMTGGTVTDATAANWGGAIYTASAGSVSVTGGTISDSQAERGGGLYVANGCAASLGGAASVTGNQADLGGGAYVDGGTLSLSGSASVTGNTAEAVADGGGVYNNAGLVRVKDSVVISGNTAASAASNLSLFGDESLVVEGDLTEAAAIGICTEKEADIDQIGVEDGVKAHLERITYDRDDAIYAIAFGTKKVVWNFAPVCKLTDADGALLYRDAEFLEPAVYATLPEGFEAAAGALVHVDGEAYAATEPIQVKMLLDVTTDAEIAYSMNRDLTLTTAETAVSDAMRSNGDTFVYVPDDDSDATGKRATIKRDFDGGSLFRQNSGALTVEGIVLDGGAVWNSDRTAHTGRTTTANGGLVHVAAGSLTLEEGATLQNSVVTENGYGGAVYVNTGVPLIVNGATVTGNQAEKGGGVYVQGPENNTTESAVSVTITGGTISDNIATNNGGGLFINEGRSASIGSQSVFSGNKALATTTYDNGRTTSGSKRTSDHNGCGGAIYVDRKAVLTVSDSTISNNDAFRIGGGVYVYACSYRYGEVTLDNVRVTGNTASCGGGVGGMQMSHITIRNGTEISGNHAVQRGSAPSATDTAMYHDGCGGGIGLQSFTYTHATAADTQSTLHITGSAVTGNDAQASGGGVYIDGGSPHCIIDSTAITLNHAATGGGLYCKSKGGSATGGVTLRNGVSITQNYTVSARGDGTVNIESAGGAYMGEGCVLTLAGDTNASNPTSIDGNTTRTPSGAEKSSNLRLPFNSTTKDNYDYSVKLTAEFKGKIRVVNPGTVYSLFGSEDQFAYLADSDDPEAWEDANITSEDGSRLFGRPLKLNGSDTDCALQWWQLPICKITDASGDLLYLDTEGTKPAAYMSLYKSANPADSAFGALNSSGVTFYKNGVAYTGDTFNVEMLSDCPINEAVKVDESGNSRKLITLTTAKDPSECADNLPYRGRKGTPAKLTVGPLYKNGNYDFLFSLNKDVSLTVKNLTVDGGANFLLDANGHMRFGANGKPLRGSDSFTSKKDGFIFLMGGSSTLILDEGATLQNGYTYHEYGGGAISFGNNGGSGRTVVMKEGSRIAHCAAKVQEASDSGSANNIGKGGYGGAITFYRGSRDTVRLEGGVIEDCWAERAGGAIYVHNANDTMEVTGGAIRNCSAANGGAIYLASDARIRMQGKLEYSDNYGTDYADFATLKNGGNAMYTGGKVRQDVFVSQFRNDPANAITITGDFADAAGNKTADGSLWIWVEQTTGATLHHRDGDQFAVLASTYAPDDDTLAEMLKVFRNARADGSVDDDPTFTNNIVEAGSGVYLTGQTGEDINGAKCVYWGPALDGFNIAFRKIDGNGDPMPGATFKLCEANEDGTIKLVSGNPVPLKAAGEDILAISGNDHNTAETAVSIQVRTGTGATATVQGMDVYCDGLVLFENVAPKATYYLVETQVKNGSADVTDAYVPLIYRLDVDEKGCFTIYAESRNAAGVSEWTTEAPMRTLSFGSGATAYDVDVYDAMNVSAKTRKVILRKVDGEDLPLFGARFKVYRADLTEIVNADYKTESGLGYYEAQSSGVYFIDTLPFGKYYLLETKAPSGGYTAGKVFTLTVDATGVTVAEDKTLTVSGSESTIPAAFLTKMGVPAA